MLKNQNPAVNLVQDVVDTFKIYGYFKLSDGVWNAQTPSGILVLCIRLLQHFIFTFGGAFHQISNMKLFLPAHNFIPMHYDQRPDTNGQDNYDAKRLGKPEVLPGRKCSVTSCSAREKRVVFMGNSITEGWIKSDPSFFTGQSVCQSWNQRTDDASDVDPVSGKMSLIYNLP